MDLAKLGEVVAFTKMILADRRLSDFAQLEAALSGKSEVIECRMVNVATTTCSSS